MIARSVAILTVSLSLVLPLQAASLEVVPTVFDFGWCPDNAKVTADFIVKNVSAETIPLTAVKPACGCTAGQFTPGDLTSQEESKITLTFNTRGYAGFGFDKPAAIQTDKPEQELSVRLRGHVLKPGAKLLPTGTGVASFEPGADKKRQTIEIQNKTDKPLTLAMVQKPAAWATAKLASDTVQPGQTVGLTVSVDGSLSEERTTSVTLEGSQEGAKHRMTVAIRTGPPPPPIRKPLPKAPPKASSPAMRPTPAR